MVDLRQVLVAMGVDGARAEAWNLGISGAVLGGDLEQPRRLAAFLAQICHESDMLRATVENLNYSADALLATFPKHFVDRAEALTYEHNPVKIGSRVYANRMGNGDEASRDGFTFRGRGLLQLTGKADYAACGQAIGMQLVALPGLLEQPASAALAAVWEWNRSGLSALADQEQFEAITRRVNGGLNGEPHRLILYDKARAALGLPPLEA